MGDDAVRESGGQREYALRVGDQRTVAGLVAVTVSVVMTVVVVVVVTGLLRGEGTRRGGQCGDGTGQGDARAGEGGLLGEFPAREGHHELLELLGRVFAGSRSRPRTNTS